MKQKKLPKKEKEKQEIDVDGFSSYRFQMLSGMFVALAGAAAGIAAVRKCYWDEIAALCIVGILMFLIMVFYLEINRIKEPDDFHAKEYRKPFLTLLLSAAIAIAGCFLPEELFPSMLIALLCSASYDRFFGMLSGGIFLCYWFLAGCGQAASLVTGILLLAAGSTIAFLFEKKERVRYGVVCVVCMHTVIMIFVRFLVFKEIEILTVVFALAGGVVCAMVSARYVPYICNRKEYIREDAFTRFLDPEYPMQKMMSSFSKVDFEHAKKVSELAGKCAVLCQAKEDVARMGGLYYRIGRMQGEPYVKNGVKLARDCDFPREVCVILKEYNGEEQLPTSLESAIVHIVDCVVTKMELFDNKTFSSEWNREMLIYQTLNEKSSSGMYDNAGLSMNLFLKLREYLAKEGDFHDN
ncbi:MAG: hypothetical protein HFG80_01595 [Eubacterium sp.]|nr:hypothetical protein [Eubacterium sp.]